MSPWRNWLKWENTDSASHTSVSIDQSPSLLVNIRQLRVVTATVTHRHLLLWALLHSDPVLSGGAQVHFVRANVVVLLGLLRDRPLRPDGCDESEESQVHLEWQGTKSSQVSFPRASQHKSAAAFSYTTGDFFLIFKKTSFQNLIWKDFIYTQV